MKTYKSLQLLASETIIEIIETLTDKPDGYRLLRDLADILVNRQQAADGPGDLGHDILETRNGTIDKVVGSIGFIRDSEYKQLFFFPAREVIDIGISDLTAGDSVEYLLVPDSKNPGKYICRQVVLTRRNESFLEV